MKYNERIRETRVDHDDTQEDLARIIECSSKQVIRYEKGEQEMTLTKLRNLCIYYGVSADYILGLPKNLKWPR